MGFSITIPACAGCCEGGHDPSAYCYSEFTDPSAIPPVVASTPPKYYKTRTETISFHETRSITFASSYYGIKSIFWEAYSDTYTITPCTGSPICGGTYTVTVTCTYTDGRADKTSGYTDVYSSTCFDPPTTTPFGGSLCYTFGSETWLAESTPVTTNTTVTATKDIDTTVIDFVGQVNTGTFTRTVTLSDPEP